VEITQEPAAEELQEQQVPLITETAAVVLVLVVLETSLAVMAALD
jgi:hypothetical protein